MPGVRAGPLVGLIVQVALLTCLAGVAGLGTVGWLAGLGYGAVTYALLTRGLYRSGTAALGPADLVTLLRATLVGGVTALVADAPYRPMSVPLLAGLAGVALLLDGVDGLVARRTGTASRFGARFDMEVDAFLILVLSAQVARSAGLWVLAIGAMRYAYVAASWVLPWMRGTLPPRYWRKVVAAAEGVALAVAVTALLPRPLAVAAVAAALALLVESFGRDVWWLWRHRPSRPGGRPRPGSPRPAAPPPATLRPVVLRPTWPASAASRAARAAAAPADHPVAARRRREGTRA